MSASNIVLDELDKKIIHELSSGIHSYEDLAKTCKVTRGTIYRRIEKLERMEAITKKIMAIPNFQNLNLSAICIGMNVAFEDVDRITEMMKLIPDVKFLWRTYGEYQIILIIVCETGCEGKTISKLHSDLSKFRIDDFRISIGYRFEKVEFSPY